MSEITSIGIGSYNQPTMGIVGGVSVNIKSGYSVPYERNDEYLKLVNQEDPRSPESSLEPESGRLLYADIDFEYNYYASGYQNFSKIAMNEHSGTGILNKQVIKFLPSINLFLLSGSVLTENDLDYESSYASVFELYKNIQSPHTFVAMNISEVLPVMFSNEQNVLSLEYFNQVSASYAHIKGWSSAHPGSQHDSIYDDKIDKLRDYYPGIETVEFVNIDMARLYADPQNKREMFPFFAKFYLTGVEKNGFCDLLENVDLVDDFIDFLVMHRNDPSGKTENVKYVNNTYDSEGTPTESEFHGTVYGYHIDTFHAHLMHSGGGSTGYTSQNAANQTTCSLFESYLNGIMFGDALERWKSTAPKDTSMQVAFRLEKSHATSGHISTHYFFNYSDLIEFKYYDSIVSYRDSFEYSLRVINVMIISGSNNEVIFTEEPYYGESIYILDSPPIAPDVEILTYRGVDYKNLILLNQMIDKEALVPIEINPSDHDQFEEQYVAQSIQPPNPIIFESDSPTDFEIFKLMEKPTSYSDFVNGEYKFVKTEGANSAAYEDKIVPNKYYYYIFRAQDPNGFPSNPSPVYEFILLKDGETMYPKIRIIDFKKPDPPTQKSKSFKKYLKIGFSPRQYTLSEDETALIPSDPTNISPGISDDNIIGSNRVFKFRIRSKNTGKLIDINVTFKKNNVIQA